MQQTYSVYPFCEACMSPVKPYLSGTSMGTSLKYENKAHASKSEQLTLYM